MKNKLLWDSTVTLQSLEKEAYRQALVYHNGNIKAVSADLAIARSTTFRKVRELFTPEELLTLNVKTYSPRKS